MIKTIVFDLGGVLVDWDPKRLYRKIFDSEDRVNWFLENVCTMEWNEQQDAGRTIKEAEDLKIDEFPNFETEIRAYYTRWHEMFSGAIQGTVHILETLTRNPNYKVVALTNWSAETWQRGCDLFPFFNLFEEVLVSGQEKLLKPDVAIYHRLSEKFHIDLSTAVFIDDREKNIKGALDAGFKAGIVFKNPEQLGKELDLLGVKM